MEFRGQIIKNLLRVLTPEEISELTSSSSEKKKVGLSLLLSSDLKGEDYQKIMDSMQVEETKVSNQSTSEAKILPFDEEEREEQLLVLQTGQRVAALMLEYGKVFKELDKKVLGPKRFPKIKSRGNRQQTSTLILEQKKKLYESYSKIKSKEILNLYRVNKDVDLVKKNGSEDDLSFSSKLGVLINKKQA